MSSDNSVPPIHGVLETCLYVNDLEQAEPFYRDVLGLTLESKQEGRHVFFYCGSQMLLLFEPTVSSAKDSRMPPHGASGEGHVALRIPAEETGRWIERLESKGVEIERIMQWPGGHRSVYFRDPSGNSLELATGEIWGFDA